jgi:hypothetical protein
MTKQPSLTFDFDFLDPKKTTSAQVQRAYDRFIRQLAKIDDYRINIATKAFRLLPNTIAELTWAIDEVTTDPVYLCREEGVEPTPENIAERSPD